MSSTIEDEIVRMSFDNKQFESGVATSLGSIDKLKSSLAFKGAGSGLDDINRSVGRFNMQPMSSAIDGVSKMWLGLATVAVTAISNITNKVIDAGLRMAKSITIDPLTAGFNEYSTNLNSIQTIIANTGAKLPVVNDALKVLNTYSDKTIYNFSQMAQNIGRFTAAGVGIDDATDAIKGMANTAALTGATSDQLNSAMYQMSQALSTGTIRLMDWNSLNNANMGTQNVQKALMATTRTFEDNGAAMDAAIAKNGNFRDSLSEGWLSAETFTKTMKVMAGTLDETTGKYVAFSIAQLEGMGYSTESAKELRKLSKAAIDSATKVKTIGQAYDVIKESIGSGWAQVFQNIFGNFEQSKKLWTGVTEFITGGISGFFEKINKALEYWNKFGGRVEVIAGLKQAFKDLLRFFVPIKNAFKEVFPPSSAKVLVTMSEAFHSFFDLFRLNVKQMHVIRLVFVAIFSAIKFGFSLIGDLVGAFKTLFGIVGGARGGGVLSGFIGTIAEAVTAFVDWAQEGDKVGKMLKKAAGAVREFFSGLKPLLPILQQVGDAIQNMAEQGYLIAEGLIDGMLEGLSVANIQAAVVEFANNIVTWIKDALGIHSPAAELVPVGVNIAEGIAQGLSDGLSSIINALKNIFSAIGGAFKALVSGIDPEEALAIINTGFFIALYIAARSFFKSFGGLIKSAKGVFDQAGGILGQITDNLKTMQNKVRSEIIRNIAISVGLLAAAAWVLSKVPSKKLALALGAITGMMVGLLTAMGVVSKGTKGAKGMDVKAIAKQTAQMYALSGAMIAFATAILIMTSAVALMGQLDPETIKKGLAGVGLVMAGLVAATAILSATGGGATIMAAAVALLVMAPALVAMAGVMKLYAGMDWETIKTGGGFAALTILALGLAMAAFGPYALSGSVGLLIVSGALLVLAGVMERFAAINGEDFKKALVGLSWALLAIVIAANAMVAAMPGALAMAVMAAAIHVLAKALEKLSQIPSGDLKKAIIAIVALMAAIGLVSILLIPAIIPIALLGAAFLVLGAGLFLAGTGMWLFGTGLALVAAAGAAAFAVLGAAIISFLEMSPLIAQQFGLGMEAWAAVIEEKGPLLIHAFGTLIISMCDEFIRAAPSVRDAIIVYGHVIIDVIKEFTPDVIEVILKLALGLVAAFTGNMPAFVDAGILTVLAFMEGIRKRKDELIDKAGDLILDFMGGIAKAIDERHDEFMGQGLAIGRAILRGIGNGIDEGWEWLKAKVASLAGDLLKAAMEKLKINSPSKVFSDIVGRGIPEGIAHGLDRHTSIATKAAEGLANKSLEALTSTFKNSKNAANGMMDIRPKVTPILDLSQLEKDATKIGGSLGRHTIKTNVSSGKAQDISRSEALRRRDHDGADGGNEYNFINNIKSADPINHVKVYRSTKAQIALFKEVTGK